MRRRGESGATAVEYGLLVAGVVAMMLVALHFLEQAAGDAYRSNCDSMTGVSCTHS